MSISFNSVNGINAYTQYSKEAELATQKKDEVNKEATTKKDSKNYDTFEKSDRSAEIQALMEEHQRQIEDFKKQVLSIVLGQEAYDKLQTTNAEVVKSAQEAISENGEWGVNAVADRIMSFAKALANGDSSKIDLLRDAVIKGFEAAGFLPDDRENCGMPEITGQTYDEIMSRFDQWKEESAGETATE